MRITTLALLAMIALPQTLLSEVKIGSSKEDVISEWGQPSVRSVSGNKETLIYVDGKEAQLQNGKVVSLLGGASQTTPSTQIEEPQAPPPPPPAKKAKKPPERKSAVVAPPPVAPPKQPEPEPVSPPPAAAPEPSPSAAPAGVKEVVAQLGDRNPKNRLKATQEILRIGQPAVDPLVAYGEDSSNPLIGHENAVDMLAQILGPASADIFVRELTNKNWGAVQKTVQVLTPMKDRRAVEPMLRLLETADYAPELRRLICIALGEIGDPACISMLMFRFKLEQDEIVQIEMANAMDKITGQKHYYDLQGRLDWIDKNHPEWLKEGVVSFKTPEKSYVKIGVIGGIGIGAALLILYLFWKRF